MFKKKFLIAEKNFMHGSNVFTFTNQNVPLIVDKLLKKGKIKNH